MSYVSQSTSTRAVIERLRMLTDQIQQLSEVIEDELRIARPEADLGGVDFDLEALMQDVNEWMNLNERVWYRNETAGEAQPWLSTVVRVTEGRGRLVDELIAIRLRIDEHRVIEARRLLRTWLAGFKDLVTREERLAEELSYRSAGLLG